MIRLTDEDFTKVLTLLRSASTSKGATINAEQLADSLPRALRLYLTEALNNGRLVEAYKKAIQAGVSEGLSDEDALRARGIATVIELFIGEIEVTLMNVKHSVGLVAAKQQGVYEGFSQSIGAPMLEEAKPMPKNVRTIRDPGPQPHVKAQ